MLVTPKHPANRTNPVSRGGFVRALYRRMPFRETNNLLLVNYDFKGYGAVTPLVDWSTGLRRALWG